MKTVKRILLGFVSIIVIIGAIAFLLPKTVYVQRSANIDASAETVFAHIANFRKFNEWSPWAMRDPDTVFDYSGPAEGVGAKMSWDSTSPEVGSGTQEIVETRPNEFVRVSLDFGGQGIGSAHYTLTPTEAGTRIDWVFETDLGYNPVARYTGLMFESWVGQDYETGLARLKTLAETVETESN